MWRAWQLVPVQIWASPRIINLKLNLMAKESEERKKSQREADKEK